MIHTYVFQFIVIRSHPMFRRQLGGRCGVPVKVDCKVEDSQSRPLFSFREDLRRSEKKLYDMLVESAATRKENVETAAVSQPVGLSFAPFRLSLVAVGKPLALQVFVAQNRVRAIEGFEGLTLLRKLDLGANRIRYVMW